ncbi:unnamed protein product, partial [Polarella glacialis]
YGARCVRRNPQHLADFSHPAGGATASTDSRKDEGPVLHPPPVPPPRPPPAIAPPPPPAAAGQVRRCKFGCGQVVNRDARRVYDTCCRLCGVCQGSGRHDACCAGGATEDKAAGSSSAAEEAEGEAAALLAADYALELRRRAFDFQLQGDSAGAKQLLADSGEQLELAKSRVPRGSKLAGILEAAVHAWRRAEGLTNDNDSNECVEDGFEERVDQELERLVAELEKVLQETAPTAARRMPDSGTGRGSSAIVAASTALVPHCRFGCGRVANTSKRGAFDTCCRACAMSQGVGGHDSGCTGAATSEPTDALVPISTDLVPLSSAVEARAEGHAGGAEGAHRPEQPALGSPAQWVS